MAQQIGEAVVAAEQGEEIEPVRPRILQIVQGIARHRHEIASPGMDRAVVDVKDGLTAKHEEQFGGVVMGMGRHPVVGIVHLEKQRAATIASLTEQGEAAVVFAAEAIALQLIRVKDARQHGPGAVHPCWSAVRSGAIALRSLSVLLLPWAP